MDKKSIDRWIAKATVEITPLVEEGGKINSTYDGKIAAFGVSLAMIGLKPTLAMYYNNSESGSVKTRPILDVIAVMMNKESAEILVQTILPLSDNSDQYRKLYKEIKECAIALKMVVRTYPQTTNNG